MSQERVIDVAAHDLKVGDMLRDGLMDRWTVRNVAYGNFSKKVTAAVDNKPLGVESATVTLHGDYLVPIYRPLVTGMAAIIEAARDLQVGSQQHNLGGLIGDQRILDLVIQLAQEVQHREGQP